MGALIVQEMLLSHPDLCRLGIAMGTSGKKGGFIHEWEDAEVRFRESGGKLPPDFALAHYALLMYPSEVLGDDDLWEKCKPVVAAASAVLLDENFDIVRAQTQLSPFRLVNEGSKQDEPVEALEDLLLAALRDRVYSELGPVQLVFANAGATSFTALVDMSDDAVDWIFRTIAALARGANQFVSVTQTGRLRWYAANMAFGLIVVLLIAVGLL